MSLNTKLPSSILLGIICWVIWKLLHDSGMFYPGNGNFFNFKLFFAFIFFLGFLTPFFIKAYRYKNIIYVLISTVVIMLGNLFHDLHVTIVQFDAKFDFFEYMNIHMWISLFYMEVIMFSTLGGLIAITINLVIHNRVRIRPLS